MKKYNYTEIRERFTHVDGEFVSASCSLRCGDSFYKIRLYPWWEHPLVIDAIEKSKDWRINNTTEGKKEITIIPKNIHEFHISDTEEIIDIGFYESHPLLWDYEDTGKIFCNSSLIIKELIEELIKENSPFITKEVLLKYFDPYQYYDPPFALPLLPYSLFVEVKMVLNKMKVSIAVPYEPEKKLTPKIFIIDEEDFIIADDFDIELPEFEHKNEWFGKE